MLKCRSLLYGLVSSSFIVLTLLLGSNVRADTRSVSSMDNLGTTTLNNEFVGVRPQIGFLNYDDPAQNGYTTMTVGVTGEMNALKITGGLGPDWFIGPETGLIYSHLSPASSSLLYAPLNVRVSYMLMDAIRVGGHGGGNLIYRSTADAMRLNDTPEGPDASLSFYPNVGGDLEIKLSKAVNLTFRPDLTFTPGSNFLAVTAGVLIPLA